MKRALAVVASTLVAWASTGCGGGSKTGNQVAISVTGSASILVPKQSEVLTAIVTGATDVSADFKCTFTTTPDPTTATPSPKASDPKPCEDSTVAGKVGALSNIQNTKTTESSTATFTAPDAFPDHTTFPNVVVTITATAHANTKKTNTFPIAFDSGVRITMTPTTATLAVGETKPFTAKDFNGNIIANDQVTWGVTFETTAKVDSASCSGGSNDCGSLALVNGTEVYTAPAKVPTAPTQASGGPAVNPAGVVTIFVFSNVDNKRIASGSITIVAGGTITFNGISPATVPLGGPLVDLFLNAPNVTSQTGIILTGPGVSETIDSVNSNKIKVVFAAGSTTSSIGARVRLDSSDLPRPGTYTVQVSQNGVTLPASFDFKVVAVTPSVITTSPDNFQQSTLGSTTTNPPQFIIDGGYFGGGNSPVVNAPEINGISPTTPPTITARQILVSLPLPAAPPTATAGLFPVTVTNSLGSSPLTAHTNVTIIPDYGSQATNSALRNPPTGPGTFPLPAGGSSVPSAVAIDSVLGVGAITLAGATGPNVQFFSVDSAGNVTFFPLPNGIVSSSGSVPTGVAIDDQLHIAAVVNYATGNLAILNVPDPNDPNRATLPTGTVDLSHVVPPPPGPPPTAFTGPFPYSVGIDPFLHRAIVAFANTNIGVIVNLDSTKAVNCILGPNPAPNNYCPIGFVSLSTGDHPQIAFEPQEHIAYISPGGSGILEGINLSSLSGQGIHISKVTRTANSVEVITTEPHGINSGIAAFGNPTILISNVPAGSAKGTNFNGTFTVTSVGSDTEFTYSQSALDDSATCAASDNCLMSAGTVNFAFQVSPSLQGIAVNPITRRLALVNPNSQSSQVQFLDPLSRSLTAMTIFKDAVAPTLGGAPEIGETAVAFQPFSNTAVVFNPTTGVNQISLIDPSLLQRPALVPTNQTGNGSVPIGAGPPLVIPGSIVVDAAANQAVAVNAGSGTLTVVGLGTIKSVHIQELRTPDVPGTTLRHAYLNTSGGTPANDLTGVQIFGSGFDNSSQVRLDGVPAGTITTPRNSHELTVTIPKAFLATPHRFAVDVVTAGVVSNSVDFTVLQSIDIPGCGTAGAPIAAAPGGVAIDEQRNLAIVTNTACHQVSLISLDPVNQFGQIAGAIQTGDTPTGVAVLPQLTATLGVAVVTNKASGSVSILDIGNKSKITDLTVGTGPLGVAINQQTNLAVIANSGSNSISAVDLSPLASTPAGTLTVLGPVGVDQNPIAVAIDPDRGSNGRGLAVVTALQLNGGSAPTGVLDAIDIGGAVPARSTTAVTGSFLSASPTGIFFDPAANSGSTTSPGLFFGVTSQSNQVVAFNPDTGATRSIAVGINPVSVALNFNSGTVLSVNALSNTISLVDAQTFQIKESIGIGGTGLLSAAVHTLQNLAVIADQGNNRVLLLPLP